MRLFVLLIAILFFQIQDMESLKAYDYGNPCLDIPESWKNVYWENPWDSCLVDTCKSSPTYGLSYSRGLEIYLFNNIFKLDTVPVDTILTWRDIDDKYIKEKEDFKKIEEKFGNYYLKRSLTFSDSLFLIAKCYWLYFDSFKNFLDFYEVINDINSIRQFYLNVCHIEYVGISNPDVFKKKVLLIPDIDFKKLKLEFDNSLLFMNENLIEIIDVRGNIVYNKKFDFQNNQEIDISNLINGTYFIRINQYSQKFIINR